MSAGRRATTLALLIAAALVVPLALGGCTSTRDNGGPDPALRGQWQLLSAKDAAGRIPLANQLITLTIASDKNTNGRSTCTDYTARILGPSTNLWVTAKLPMAEHCGIQAQQDIEHRYITDLGQVRSAQLTANGGILDLVAPGIQLEYQRALVIPLNLIVSQTWSLVSANADSYYSNPNPTIVPATGANLYFGTDGILTGSTACQQFVARYAENAGELVVTRMDIHNEGPCSNTQLTDAGYLMSVIQSGFTFLTRRNQLLLSSPRAELTLTFTS